MVLDGGSGHPSPVYASPYASMRWSVRFGRHLGRAGFWSCRRPAGAGYQPMAGVPFVYIGREGGCMIVLLPMLIGCQCSSGTFTPSHIGARWTLSVQGQQSAPWKDAPDDVAAKLHLDFF